MVRGNVQSGFTESDHVIEGQLSVKNIYIILEGEIRIGSQNHFYLETQASLVMPKLEDDEFEIWSSTQNPTETQVCEIRSILNNWKLDFGCTCFGNFEKQSRVQGNINVFRLALL